MKNITERPSTVAVAFCSDPNMELALHVAASSVLRHLSPGITPKFYLLLTDFSAVQVRKLHLTLDRLDKPYELILLETPNVEIFHKLRPFHGSFAAYYRLLLPDMMPERRFLYLDLDTITNIDIAPLFSIHMQGHALGFVADGFVKYALEHQFFQSLGMNPDGPSFNSGIMLVDTDQWKQDHCFQKILAFCNAHPDALVAADQTALNALYWDDCFHLHGDFNIELSTVSRQKELRAGIYHFVGSPKPWDLFGGLFHPYHSLWKEAMRRVALNVWKKNSYLNLRNWWRLPKILGGYRRILRQRSEIRRTLAADK
ncbi:glycosyltransferase family 8 protein [Granulicella sp. dw_53]|uniref:glycosyltransferase family 8 protein n=1 Tax=Granulicella sp. dw_53 TaxID=2719792 RepID=UPI001BD4BE44|nr:glycosyltransferase family 8 protein [Granulicella sp. dw_53]